ncbi:LacI family DNA-binding transcriptional regulator [Cronobacter turicensis]|nr:LacI family DNA-binding transcriptional regulator [Cronobacter turicensis]
MKPRQTRGTVTAQDVAARAGVSRAVVSRAFSDSGSISPDTKTRVLAAAAELGYQVNFLAQGLNRQRSQLIGVVVARIGDPFRSALLEALLNAISRRGYQALVTEISDASGLETTLRRFMQYRVSGVVVTSGQPPEAIVKECVQHQIPVVGINRPPACATVDTVCSDNAQGAALAAIQLRNAGCQRFGWLNYQHSTWAGQQRGAAFLTALGARGVSVETHVTTLHAPQEGYEGGLAAALDARVLPDGIFCANAQLACGFLDGMRRLGKTAPRDFHLIGFDNTPQTAWEAYQLTTLDQDVTTLAARALTTLAERARHPDGPARIERVPVTLIHRRTSPRQS